uniref:Secreted protein n=1 Tax=Setaria viridis TaxID=4556 RepID=A0A4U6T3J2_SETVI|nr:hypothetical protein SEVIR_9G414632v2 [Setaria viridis]
MRLELNVRHGKMWLAFKHALNLLSHLFVLCLSSSCCRRHPGDSPTRTTGRKPAAQRPATSLSYPIHSLPHGRDRRKC